MNKIREAAALMADLDRKIVYDAPQKGVTGKLDANGNLASDPTSGLSAGYEWVRLGTIDPLSQRAAAAVRTKRIYDPGVIVETAVNRMTGEREILGLPAIEGTQQFGSGAAAVEVGLSGQYTGVLVKPNDIIDLQVIPDTQGGLWARVTSGYYPGGYFAGGIVLLVPTATSSKKALICIGIDRDGSIVQELTADVGLVYTLTAQDAASTIADNPDTTWLVGIGLHNGDTTIDLANRTLVNLAPTKVGHVKHNLSATTAPGVGDDSADGYSIGSRWVNASTDLSYVCTDSTAGAAVWQLDVLAINALTTDSSPDTAADYIATYDASASAHKKVLLSTLLAANSTPRYFAVYNYRNGTEPKIGLATSDDGRTWTRTTEPLLTYGSGGAQDDTHLAHPCIVANEQNHLYLYYGGWSGTNYAVMLARSFDYGATWTKYGTVLSASEVWENSNVSWARVLYDREESNSSKRWKMWYIGDNGTGGIGYAYSSDGLSWTKFASNPVVGLGTSGQWDDALLETGDIIRLGDVYYLFYGGTDAAVNPTWSVGYVTFTDPEGTYTRSADNPILTGDSISQDVSTNIAVNDTSIHVASANVYPIGAPVWIYDNSSVTNKMLTTVAARTDSTHITIADPAIHSFTTAQVARVRSAAYNSIVPIRVIYDGGWLFTVTAFQPEFWTSNIHEISMFAYGKELSQLYLDYSAGSIIPITADESDLSDVSFENPYIFDKWMYSDRTQTPLGDATAIHTDVAGEIAGLTQKVTPVSGDYLVIEDSAAGNVKKYVTIGDLPTGSFTGDAFDVPYTPTTSGDWSATPSDAGEALDTLAADVAALGSGSSPYTSPPTTGWSWLNQGTSTINSSSTRQYLEAPANATFQIRGRYRDQPTPPYTITAAFKFVALDGNCHVGFLWYDGSTEAMTFGPGQGTSDGQTYRVWYKWDDYDSLNSSYFNTTTPFWHLNPLWLRIEDDNTNIKVHYSADGENFIEVSSQTRTNWLTPSKVGFFVCPGSTNKMSVTLLSWEEA